MLQDLREVFKSTVKSLEVLYVLENTKPAARILAGEHELQDFADFFYRNGLEFSVSDFKLKRMDKGPYSNKSIKIDKNSPEKGYFIAYVSKTRELTEKAKAFEANNMHVELGMVLGYPKCCCDFFSEKFNEHNCDLVLDGLENSEGSEFPFYTNIATRHFDVSLLSHFPCSFGCGSSIEIAKENLGTLRKHSRGLSERFEEVMKSAILYSGEGVFLLKGYRKEGNCVRFMDVVPTIKNELYDELIYNKKITIINKNKIKIGNEEISGIGLMRFT